MTKNGRSALGHATYKGLAKILELLLQSCQETTCCLYTDAKRTKPNEYEKTPDGMEGMQWEEEIPDSDDVCEDEWSKLYVYYARMIEKTGDMLLNTVKLKDPHCLDAFSHSPIHYAVIRGDTLCTKLLLEHNAPIDITTNLGFTPLHLAVKHPEVVKILLANSSNPNKRIFQNLETPLHTAARVGNAAAVSMLIHAGADVNAVCIIERSPLILAIISENIEIANILIDYGSKLNTQDAKGSGVFFLFNLFQIHFFLRFYSSLCGCGDK